MSLKFPSEVAAKHLWSTRQFIAETFEELLNDIRFKTGSIFISHRLKTFRMSDEEIQSLLSRLQIHGLYLNRKKLEDPSDLREQCYYTFLTSVVYNEVDEYREEFEYFKYDKQSDTWKMYSIPKDNPETTIRDLSKIPYALADVIYLMKILECIYSTYPDGFDLTQYLEPVVELDD